VFFLSCINKKENSEYFVNVKDSIDYYFDKVDNSNLSDSIKSKYNRDAYSLIKKIKKDSIRFKYSFKSGARFYNLKSYDDYKKVSKDVINNAIRVKDTLIEAKGYIYLGDYYLMKNQYDSAFYNYDKAEIKYVSVGNTTKINEARLNKSTVQYFKKDYVGCETTILRALPFLIKEGNAEFLFNSFNTIGLCRIETNEFEAALEYFNKSLKYVDKFIEQSGAKEMSLNNIGYTYLMMEDYKKANSYFERVLTPFTKENFIRTYYSAKLNHTYSNFNLGNLNDFEEDINEVIENYNKLNISVVQPKIYLSEYYESLGQVEKAQELALEAYNISIKDELYRDKLRAIKQLTNVFPEQSKFYSTEYVKLNDSIAAVDKKIQNTFARIEYRVDELSNENILLEERNKRIIFYSVIVLLMFSLFYFYRWQKQKQREFLLVQEQQNANEQVYNLMINQQVQMDKVKAHEQKRISQELHDGVLGKLFGARMNLDILNNKETDEVKKDKQKYIHEIIEVEKQIRQISHELNDDKRSIINNYQLLLDRFVEDQETLLKLKIDYSFTKKTPWGMVTAEEKINLYRIIQESFQNINKYAEADKVTFSIEYFDNKLKVSILDDGIGFDVKKASKRSGNGIGIKNMKDRANLINANFKIESELFNGTRTQIILHINPNNEF
jgi:signal transduction histidine kinase